MTLCGISLFATKFKFGLILLLAAIFGGVFYGMVQ